MNERKNNPGALGKSRGVLGSIMPESVVTEKPVIIEVRASAHNCAVRIAIAGHVNGLRLRPRNAANNVTGVGERAFHG